VKPAGNRACSENARRGHHDRDHPARDQVSIDVVGLPDYVARQAGRSATTAGHADQIYYRPTPPLRAISSDLPAKPRKAVTICGDVVPPIGSEPTKRDQRLDCAVLDFDHEADFALRVSTFLSTTCHPWVMPAQKVAL
jgi:hypothetical protein